MTTGELVAGYLYLPFYLVLLATLLDLGAQLLNLQMSDVEFNCVWFACNFVIIWIIFGKFLVRSLRAIRFWELVQALILGFVMYYVGEFLYGRLMAWLNVDLINYNDRFITMLIQQGRVAMIICGVILVPMVEETLTRGLIFGVIRRKSRIAAYLISIIFFTVIHVWQYVSGNSIQSILFMALRYVPVGIALGWTYEKSNTIWAPILLHMTINAISFGVVSFL
jgi:membrane protease YdiL (CAAX protease family)